MFQHSTKFEILSKVNSEDDVFDKLIRVRHVLSGQEGTLVCSHASEWPVELVPQATWLAGCYTPDTAPTEKLVLGIHAEQEVLWIINKQKRTLVLTLKAELEPEVFRFIQQVWISETHSRQLVKVRAIVRLLNVSKLDSWKKFCAVYNYCHNSPKQDLQDLRPTILQVLTEDSYYADSIQDQQSLTSFLYVLAATHNEEVEEYTIEPRLADATPSPHITTAVPTLAASHSVADKTTARASSVVAVAVAVAALPVAIAGIWASLVIGISVCISADNIIHSRPVLQDTILDQNANRNQHQDDYYY